MTHSHHNSAPGRLGAHDCPKPHCPQEARLSGNVPQIPVSENNLVQTKECQMPPR